MDQGFRRGFSRRNLLIPTRASAFHPPTAFRTSDVGCPFMSAKQTFSTRSLTSENDPKRPSATHSRLHFGRPEPWEGRLAALLVSRVVLTKAQMSACGNKVKFSAQSVHYRR